MCQYHDFLFNCGWNPSWHRINKDTWRFLLAISSNLLLFLLQFWDRPSRLGMHVITQCFYYSQIWTTGYPYNLKAVFNMWQVAYCLCCWKTQLHHSSKHLPPLVTINLLKYSSVFCICGILNNVYLSNIFYRYWGPPRSKSWKIYVPV